MVADPVGGNTYFKNFMNGFAEAMKIVVYQTFALKTLFSKNAN